MKKTVIPSCRQCSKPLRPNFEIVCVKCERPIHQHAMSANCPRPGIACQEVFRASRKVEPGRSKKMLTGYGRNDLFCSIRHGFYWAVTQAGVSR